MNIECVWVVTYNVAASVVAQMRQGVVASGPGEKFDSTLLFDRAS
ncbi:MAG: hypothetical protein ACLFVS_03960 [Candidatus Acetothermia bacterium]